MVAGRTQQLPISVQPAGATVCLDGQKIGTSPMVAQLSRKRSHVLVVEQEGYQPVVRALAKEVNPWIVLNFVPLILIPGPIGLGVDVATGAVNTFNVGSFDFYLQKRDTTAAPASPRPPCSPF
jgi:hypothetical protein